MTSTAGRRPVTGRVLATLLGVAVLALAGPLGTSAAPAAPRERWIVQLAHGTQPEKVLGRARLRLGVRAEHVYRNAVRGFAARLNGAQRMALLRDPRVLSIEPDHPISATFEPQQVQPGTRRVRAPDNPDRATQPLDVDIAVLDTGIQPDHPDLNVVGGYNCTDAAQSESARQQPSAWRDGGFGHGTHVAGIAAARDNSRGVVGVAPGARLWSIKVLDHDGLGYWSWVICGLDWVAGRTDQADTSAPLIEVVNMSLAGGGSDDGNCGLSNSDVLHQAVCRVDRRGVTIVAAAGNEAANTRGYVPAAYGEVIAVSAIADYDGRAGGLGTKPLSSCAGTDDAFATFSNHGPAIDLTAPGVCVLSTLPGGRYGRMSGTSMATPHVTGGAALFHLWDTRHGRPHPRPQAVRAALVETGVLDWRTGTDADRNTSGSVREPLLNAASFALPVTFRIGATPQVQRRSAGQSVHYDVWIARLGGFAGSIDFNVDGLPAGATWSVEPDPMGADGSGWRRIAIQLPASGSAGTHDVQIRGRSGSVERLVGVRLHFDAPATAGVGPRLQLRSGVTTGIIALPARVRWAAVSGATRYQLQVSRDGGDWQAVSLPTDTATRVNRAAWPGSSYQHRVRALRNGVWGAWTAGATSFPVPRYGPSDGVALTGTWAVSPNPNTYSQLPVYSTQQNAQAVLAFEGRSVSWIATRGPRRGKARVFVDGALAATVDLYASTTQHRRVVFSTSWADAGPHTIEIRVLGTSGRPRVDVDAVVVVEDR